MPRAPALIRSGWWVACAAAAVVAALLLLALTSSGRSGRPTLGDGRTVASYGFDLAPALVDPGTIVAAGMPRDGLHALEAPATMTVAEVDAANHQGRGKLLLPHDRVVGVALDGQARAYPLRLLRWHEVVNDRLGGRDILVTYNPLCDSAVASGRRLGGETLDFGVSGLVLDSNMLIYDRREDPAAGSLWSQLEARAVAGPLAGGAAELELLPATVASWEQWRQRHPTTDVLAPVDRLALLYKRDPYHSYFGSDLLRFPVDPLPPPGELHLKDRVLVVTADGRDEVLPLRRLADQARSDRGTWEGGAAGVPLRVAYDLELGTAVVEPLADPGPGFATRQCFWFAWYATSRTLPPR